MNSLQLITKIKSRMLEFSQLGEEMLNQNNNLLRIEKEVLKKSCTELYELLLKLKTDEDKEIEQFVQQETYKQKTQNAPVNISNEIKNEAHVTENEPQFLHDKLATQNQEITLNEIATISEIQENISVETKNEPLVILNTIEPKTDLNKPNDWKPELKIGRTVMPDIPKNEPKTEEDKTDNFVYKNTPKEELSFNERIAQNKNNYAAPDKVIEPKIDNLKMAISLNKKIAFVNDLFTENVVDYAKSIDRINNASDLNEAMRFFSELKHQYNWQNNNELVSDLEKLIQRRF